MSMPIPKTALGAWGVLLLLVLAPLLGGCDGGRSNDGKIPIRFVTWKPNQPEVWDQVLSAFEKENPDLRIIREIGPHSSTAFHDLLTQKLKNRSTDVDVFFMDVVWPPEFAEAGWAAPLDERLPPEEQARFVPGALMAGVYKGRVYGVPMFMDAGMLFFRKDLLARYGFSAPATWQHLVEQAARIVEGEAGGKGTLYGYTGQFKQYEGLVCNMMEFILGHGGHILDPKTGRCALTQERALQAVRFVRERLLGTVAPRGVLSYQEPESLDVFVQGRAIFHRNWPYAWQVANDPQRSRIAGKVGIALLPHFPGHKSAATLGGWHLGISRFSRHPEAAWRLIRFLTSPRIQKRFALRAGKAPTRSALYEEPEVLAANPHFGRMKEVFLAATPRPRSPLYPAISNVLQRFFSMVLSASSADLAAEAARACNEMDRILALGP